MPLRLSLCKLNQVLVTLDYIWYQTHSSLTSRRWNCLVDDNGNISLSDIFFESWQNNQPGCHGRTSRCHPSARTESHSPCLLRNFGINSPITTVRSQDQLAASQVKGLWGCNGRGILNEQLRHSVAYSVRWYALVKKEIHGSMAWFSSCRFVSRQQELEIFQNKAQIFFIFVFCRGAKAVPHLSSPRQPGQ